MRGRWLGAAGAAFILAGCQQGSPGNGANAADGGAAENSAAAAAPRAPHPVTMEPDPANQTGPVGRDVDAGFPEPCQAYVREIQACLDSPALAASGAEAAERRRELRLLLHSNRGTWLGVEDRAGLTNICRDQRGQLRDKRAEYRC